MHHSVCVSCSARYLKSFRVRTLSIFSLFIYQQNFWVQLWGESLGPLSHPPLSSPAVPGWSTYRLKNSMAFHSGVPPECPRLPEIALESQFRAARDATPSPGYP